MQAMFNGANNASLFLTIPLEDFLSSGPMFRQSQAAMCEPEELLLDFVSQDLDWDSDEEMGSAFAEACILASDHAVSKVDLCRSDVAFIKRHFAPNHGMRLVTGGWPELIA